MDEFEGGGMKKNALYEMNVVGRSSAIERDEKVSDNKSCESWKCQPDTAEASRIRSVYAQWERTRGPIVTGDPRHRLRLLERNSRLETILAERFPRSVSNCRVLDIGCGRGSLLHWFHERGAPPGNLFGIDLLPDRIKSARETYPDITFIEGSAEQLNFSNESFDLVAVFTVFSSILDGTMARRVAREIHRVLVRHGAVIWYDMRYPSPRNPHIRAMTKSRIHQLFPTFDLELKSDTLLPPLARLFGSTTSTYRLISAIPLLRSHYLGLLRPPDSLTV
jgi:ubiquinone/menaquinone biosynthesis C-methylase UbiE